MDQKGFGNLLIVAVVGIFLLVLGYSLGHKDSTTKTKNLESQVLDLENQLRDKDNQITNAQSDIAEGTVEKDTPPYDFATFGVYSSQLVGKQVHVTDYNFKGTKIVRKEVYLREKTVDTEGGQQSSPTMGIIVYQYPGSSSSTNPAVTNGMATFDGYENYGPHAIYVSDLQKTWKEEYKNKVGIDLFVGYDYAPKMVSAVTINFTSSFSPMGGPIYVKVWRADIPFGSKETDPAVIKAKNDLKDFAETLSLTKN